MPIHKYPFLIELGSGAAGRWKLWVLFSLVALVAAFGTWVSGQYKIGRLDALKNRYDQPIVNFAKSLSSSQKHTLEYDLLEGCRQNQIGTWLQTTDALHFRGPMTGNRIEVSLDDHKAFLDLNGKEISMCVQGDIEDLQFDIGSMVNTWAVVLLLLSFCIGVWAWVCYYSQVICAHTSRNVYAETLERGADVDAQNDSQNNEAGSQDPTPSDQS
ncbi:MAG TPA: hypothetical protein PLK94_08445 [Alphaproteobacteria bacterium]|nr:hypothetical protein [Alphaproteobacteria bacterium]HOO51299.1 hypothetical protein [Alphaproteobacteria bacterium]